MGWRLLWIPTRTLDREKLVLMVFVTAMLSMESRSRRDAVASKASLSSMSVSNGLYFGRDTSLVTL